MVFDEDEQYELISKERLLEMKKELEKLRKKDIVLKERKKIPEKAQIQSDANDLETNIDNTINKVITNSNLKESKRIFSELNEIKELNKQTLNNIIDKYENLEHNVELISDHLTEIVKYLKINKDKLDTVSENIVSIKDNTENLDANKIIKKIENLDDYKVKLNYIENFMNKLSILLSQLKPNNGSLEYDPQINFNNNQNKANYPSNPLSNQQSFSNSQSQNNTSQFKNNNFNNQ